MMCRWASEMLEVVCGRTSCSVEVQFCPNYSKWLQEARLDIVESLMTFGKLAPLPGRGLETPKLQDSSRNSANHLDALQTTTKWPTSKNRPGILPS